MGSLLELKNARTKPTWLTPDRQNILRLLVEYRSLTTSQIWCLFQDKFGAKSLRRIQSDLAALKRAGAVSSFEVRPETGPGNEFAWLLLKQGARKSGFDNFRYGSHYRREPNRHYFETLSMRLELEKAVEICKGWQLIRPQTYSRGRPLPDRTPQYWRLAEALTWQEYHGTGRWPAGGVEGSHTLSAPLKANHYVAYTHPRPKPIIPQTRRPDSTFNMPGPDTAPTYCEEVVVFILCPPRAGEKFWLARNREYQQLARQLLVFGVFENDEKALNHKPLLGKAGLRVTTLSRVSTILEGLGKPK